MPMRRRARRSWEYLRGFQGRGCSTITTGANLQAIAVPKDRAARLAYVSGVCGGGQSVRPAAADHRASGRAGHGSRARRRSRPARRRRHGNGRYSVPGAEEATARAALPSRTAAAAEMVRAHELVRDQLRHRRPGRDALQPPRLFVQPLQRRERVVLAELRLLYASSAPGWSRHRPAAAPGTDGGPCRHARTRSAPVREPAGRAVHHLATIASARTVRAPTPGVRSRSG